MIPGFLLALALAAGPPPRPPPVVGMDHIPVVVADLEKAQAAYRALGFAIKPGRHHDDGITNAHVKFADGTEVELITPPAVASDALTTEYRRRLSSGEGPVYHGLYAPDLDALRRRLTVLGRRFDPDEGMVGFGEGDPLHSLFFGGRQKAPTDRPEHFLHANGATGLIGVLLRGARAEARLLPDLGARPSAIQACGPLGAARRLLLRDGEVLILPGPAAGEDRAVVGAVLRVRNLAQTKAWFAQHGVAVVEPPRGCGRRSLWLSATTAPGLWLEFRQAPG